MADGGIARNVVPASFSVNVNHRFPPDRTVEEAEVRLREVCAPADSIEITDAAPPGTIPEGNEHLDRLVAISGAQVTAKQAWTDVARLTQRGIPALNFGPGETALAHHADESVSVDALEISLDILQRFFRSA